MKQAAKMLFETMGRADPKARVAVRFWDGETFAVGDAPAEVTLVIRTEKALQRCLTDGFLGFGECYTDGDLEIEGDAETLFRLGHLGDFGALKLSWKEKLRFAALFLMHQNTKRRAAKNIAHHYSIGNDFYELFLDDTLAYTCAYFKSPDETLEQAQQNKYEYICRKVILAPGDHIADLGCGWGGLLIYAAETRGVTGVGVTVSKPQADLANARIAERGLQDRIRVEYKDYRALEGAGTFDKVVSVGMLEHVGKRYVGPCIGRIAELLKPGGLACIHCNGHDIPYPDDPWFDAYIFPGIHVPTLSHITGEMGRHKLCVLDVENLRRHYTLTLRHWLQRYEAHYDTVRARFDERFARMWWLYLAIAMTSYEYGGNRLFHFVVSKGLNNDVPLTRDHLYQ